MSEQHENPKNEKKTRTITEELEITGGQIVERLQEIVREGNVRRIIVRTPEGRQLLNTTLTTSAVATGALAITGLLGPVALMALVGGVITRVKVELVREVHDGDVLRDNGKRKVEIPVQDDAAGDNEVKVDDSQGDDTPQA